MWQEWRIRAKCSKTSSLTNRSKQRNILSWQNGLWLWRSVESADSLLDVGEHSCLSPQAFASAGFQITTRPCQCYRSMHTALIRCSGIGFYAHTACLMLSVLHTVSHLIDKMLWNINTTIMYILQWERNKAQRISDLPEVTQSSNQDLQLMCWGQHWVWWDEFSVRTGRSIKWRLCLSYFHSHKTWSNLETVILLPIFSPYSFCFQPLHNFSMTSHFMKECLKSACRLVIQFSLSAVAGWVGMEVHVWGDGVSKISSCYFLRTSACNGSFSTWNVISLASLRKLQGTWLTSVRWTLSKIWQSLAAWHFRTFKSYLIS